MLFIIVTSTRIVKIVYFLKVDLATEREQQLTTVRGLTNGRAANWAPEVAFSPFRAFSCRHLTFPFCCFQPSQPNIQAAMTSLEQLQRFTIFLSYSK